MHVINRKLALIALTAALASPLAFAQSAPANPAQATDSAAGAVQDATAQPATQPAAVPAQAATEMASTAQPQRKSWESIDTDADGKISATEAQSDAALLKQFPAIDTDKDGFVTVAEYKAHVAAKTAKGKKSSAQG